MWKAFTGADIDYSNKYYTKVETAEIAVTNIHDNRSFASVFSAIKLLALNSV